MKPATLWEKLQIFMDYLAGIHSLSSLGLEVASPVKYSEIIGKEGNSKSYQIAIP